MIFKGGRGSPKTEKVKRKPQEDNKVLQQEILNSEARFIDLYTKNAGNIRPLRMLFAFYKGHYPRLLLSVLFYIIKSSPVWIMPYITAQVINLATHPTDGMWTQMIIYAAIVLATLALNIPFHMLYVKMYSYANRHVEAGLRGAMIRKLQSLSISFHHDTQSGRIQSKVMRDVEAISDLASSILNTVLAVVVNMSITLFIVITSNISVFFMFLLCIPSAVLLNRAFRKSMREHNHEFRKEVENTASAVFDMEELIPVTRAHALENLEINKLTADVTEVARSGQRIDKVNSLFGSVSWAMTMMFQAICLFFTGYLAIRGRIGVGDVSMYQSYFNSLTGYVASLIGLLPTITRGTESIRSIGEILSAFDVEENANKPKLKTLEGRYEFKNVYFHYDNRTHVLNGLDLTVEPGETVALVGESGSGKSTIINLVIGFNKAVSGRVLVDGRDINDIDLRSYRRMISVVPQNTILFSGTVRDNITYGNSRISKETLDHAIKAARLESVIASLPDGLETSVGEHGGKLSGGQRQRISIARAIIRDPQVIIFDEATSALDSVTEREIQAAIDNLTANRTTFIVAHRLSTIRNADKIAVIRDGRCVEFGTWDELLEKKGEFYRYRMAQS
mgnify:CR=1 FL=1